MKYLITGVAGFIGYHTAKRILESNNEIIGIDNINDFYDVNLKNQPIFRNHIPFGKQTSYFLY